MSQSNSWTIGKICNAAYRPSLRYAHRMELYRASLIVAHVVIYADMTNAPIYTAHINGTDISFSAPADMPLLQAAELAGTASLKMDSSCRNGTCRTCICQLVSGEVTYRIAWPGLSLDEKREGLILPCVAYPTSDVVIDLTA
jgi:ferredoxin